VPFDWKEFLELSRDLRGQSGSGYSCEAAERTAVSRAYYGAFCHARNFAATNLSFIPSYNHKDHVALPNYFKRIGHMDIADNLLELRLWRNQCDYDDFIVSLEQIVQEAIDRAQEVINYCS
jgi:hypothetical protein